MHSNDLDTYLNALQMEDGFRIDAILKESFAETTQRVYFEQTDGTRRGPFIRKLIRRDSGLGATYTQIYLAQRDGRSFMHVPRVLECYAREDNLVVLMEYVDGETLQDYVARCGASAELASNVFPKLCDAARELHEDFNPPIIHRDLKPSNVMIVGDRLAIIDFGIARNPKVDAEADTTHFGTRAFAPPEQFGFGQTDERSDVYALGMLLYFCLTGIIPNASTRENGFSDERIPDALRSVIIQATALDPHARYANARSLKNAFLDACNGNAPNDKPYKNRMRFDANRPRKPLFDGRFQTLGGIWNTILAMAAAFLLFVCVWVFIDPGGKIGVEMVGLERVVDYLIWMPVFLIATALFLSDKRSLRRTIPFFENWRWNHWIVAYVLAILLVFFGIGLAHGLAG